MTFISRCVLTAGLLAAMTAPALATDIEAKDAWARARAPGARAGAAYVTLVNSSKDADTLVQAASPVADVVELHEHRNNNGVMEMRPVGEMTLAPGAPVTLQPGGLHIMLIGLRQDLTEGNSFPLTLTFRSAPPVSVTVKVLGVAAMGPGK